MEALLEREEEQVESWNDDRLDELNRRMDAGFEKAATKVELTAVKDQMNLRFGEVDKRFDKIDTQLLRINDRLDRFGYAIIFFAFSLSATVIASAAFG